MWMSRKNKLFRELKSQIDKITVYLGGVSGQESDYLSMPDINNPENIRKDCYANRRELEADLRKLDSDVLHHIVYLKDRIVSLEHALGMRYAEESDERFPKHVKVDSKGIKRSKSTPRSKKK